MDFSPKRGATDAIEDALEAMRLGRPVVVLDDEDRENEADLILAAERATAATVAFMVRHTSGVLCVALPAERLEQLALPLMCPRSSDSMGTAFTITADYKHGTTTGISAADRALTIRALVDPGTGAQDFHRPGHIFPLRAVAGGVLRRPGHTEASVDLARLAGLRGGGVLAELLNEDGSVRRFAQAREFADTHGLPLITIAQLIEHRLETERPSQAAALAAAT